MRFTIWRVATAAAWLVTVALLLVAFVAIQRGELRLGGACLVTAICTAYGAAQTTGRSGI